MKDLNIVVDTFEVSHSQEFPKSGGYYQGNPWNFFEGFREYKNNLYYKNTTSKIEDKLELLKKDEKALPWEE